MGRVTFDEAHMIRNLDSTFYIGARLLPTHEMLLATGTPNLTVPRTSSPTRTSLLPGPPWTDTLAFSRGPNVLQSFGV